ncbi:MAG: Phosphate transport system permease protein PstA 2 [Chloroflexi bacterium]|nr:Phosphate transport system permease protein PstA 2 [Chloroflexota bacterium]
MKAIPALTLAISALGIVLGCLSLVLNSLEAYPVPLLGFLSFSLIGLLLHVHHHRGVWERGLIILAGFSLISALLLLALPEFLYGFQINAIFHRSFISALLLFAAALPSSCSSLRHLLGATPAAEDISRYPLIILPIFLALAAYALFISHIFSEGAANLDWEIITTPYGHPIRVAGMRNHILGTLLLMALTSLISLPIGVGAGVFLSEYGGRLAGVVRFSLGALRGISVFILGITALSLVGYSEGTFLSDIITGVYDAGAGQRAADGSFLTAAIFLSLLVIPIIARATEEGIRSLPTEIREGSLALAASEGRTLTRIILPWASPNIVTGLLLGCAEAAGSLAVIMFMAGTGEHGVGLLREVTSLSYFIFDTRWGGFTFRTLMRDYQYLAALLLLVITTGLGIAALILKQRLARRYRGA